jgi:Na+-transporting methylmalonyl-CoA/oxaloacetate decarboxylase gamma subunit
LAFYVRKSLAHGRIRFGVAPRKRLEEIDTDPSLSTGAAGEFIRRKTSGFYFAENRLQSGGPQFPSGEKTAASAPLLQSVYDGTGRGWAFLAMTIIGALLLLLGMANVAKGQGVGWVLVLFGAILIAVPFLLTANVRRKIREEEERDRAARAAEEERNRAVLAAYIEALENLRKDPTDDTLDAVAAERQQLDVPYEIWSGYARTTVLHLGFELLHRLGPVRAAEMNDLVSRAARAAGLKPAHELAIKLDIYRTAVWHLLADDRLGEAQAEELKHIRKGLDIWDKDVPEELHAMNEFDRLRGAARTNLPRTECPQLPLKIHEYCIHATKGSVVKTIKQRVDGKRVDSRVPSDAAEIFITNRRVIVQGRKTHEVPLPKIDDIELDMDEYVMTIKAARDIGQVDLQMEDAIYTSAILEMATTVDDRPRAFA